jgi:uncharacterized membrane protein YdcZ (DUF606 family)
VQEIIAKRIIDIAALGTVVRAMSCKRCSPLVLLDAALARNGRWVRLFGSDLGPFTGCKALICATWSRPTKYLASAGVLTALGAIAPLWVWFQGDLLGAAIIAIPSALVLPIGLGVTWTFLQE